MAVAAAIVLGKTYPQARIWFGTLAFLVAMNRVDGRAHFASDVCWGAAIGYLVGGMCLGSRFFEAQIKRLEPRWIGPVESFDESQPRRSPPRKLAG
jgi:membrane-associated phospholipid phosphatase